MKKTISALLAAALLLAACGSSDNGTDASIDVATDVEEPATTTTTAPAPATTTTTEPADTTSTSDAPATAAAASPASFSLYDFRYCEILITVAGDDGADVTEVWGTPGVDPCTDEAWYAIDPDQIQTENEASFIDMNGPRFFVVDGTVDLGDGSAGAGVASGGQTILRSFGDVTMALLATTEPATESAPYEPNLVVRTTTWAFEAGSVVYELTDPDGDVYTMQSYSQIEDRSITAADLPTLGDRIDLPEGWSYSSRTLDEPLVVALADEGAIVVQDTLKNSYQRNG